MGSMCRKEKGEEEGEAAGRLRGRPGERGSARGRSTDSLSGRKRSSFGRYW